ncbi:MAG: hypothetical protein ACI92A_000873, partial [Candidatus Paceibacteria bacterium]
MGFLAGLLPKGDMLSDAEIARLEKQMQDFVGGGQALFGQRQGMYFGSALLAGYYYSFTLAALCFTLYQ